MTIENKQIANVQHGFATVLIVLLVGLAVAASALGTAYYINMSQKSLVSSHALTNAQSGAWTGVEVFRKYLVVLNKDDILPLHEQNLVLNVQGGRTLQVNDISVKDIVGSNPKQYRVTANIQNVSAKSESSSTIQVVYDISFNSDSSSTGSPGSTMTFSSAMNFYGDLDISGSVDLSSAGNDAVINIAGNFSANTVKGVKRINSIGSVKLSGGYGTGVEQVYSNKYIIISGSAAVTDVASALQYIRMASAQPQGDFYAGNSKKIASGQIEKEDVYVNIENGGFVRSINTLNNINIMNGGSKLGTAIAGGTINCPGTWWNNYTSMRSMIFKDNCSTKNRYELNGFKPLDATEVTEIAADTKPIVNALAYEEQANYAFSVNDKKQIMVYVRHIKGINEGLYHLGKSNNSWGYLCKSVDNNNFCTSEVVGNFGRENGSEVITYSKGLWKLEDTQAGKKTSLASGILFFKNSSVNIKGGNYANTIISTDDIEYGGYDSLVLRAPNYAKATIVCNSAYFPMPTNLCSSTSTLSSAGIGNIALLAGSCTDDSSVAECSRSYIGGNIKFSGSANIEGNIIAGNKLDTGGNTNLKGSMLAAALGRNNGSKLGATTNIDFTGTSDENTTITLPGGEGGQEEGETITQRIKVKWARYI